MQGGSGGTCRAEQRRVPARRHSGHGRGRAPRGRAPTPPAVQGATHARAADIKTEDMDQALTPPSPAAQALTPPFSAVQALKNVASWGCLVTKSQHSTNICLEAFL